MAFDISSLSTYGSGFLNLLVIIFGFIFIGGIIIVAVIFYMREKRFKEYTCIILDKYKRATFDQAGVFVDKKTNNKRFYMKKAFVGLDPNNVPYVVDGNKKYVFLFKTGLKNFHFINFNIEKNFNLTVEEEDVNWAINAYERQKKLFQYNPLLQYLPFIMLAFVSLVILILFIYLFRKVDVIRDFITIANEVAKNLAQAKAGTVVVS